MEKITRNLKLFILQQTNLLQNYTIKQIKQVDQRFRILQHSQSYHNFIQQIAANLPRLIQQQILFNKVARRLLEAICIAIEKYSYDFSRNNYLFDKINSIASNWKKVLTYQSYTFNQEQNISKFRNVLDRNEFTFYIIKTSNMLIQKQVMKSIKNTNLNIRTLQYLKKNNLQTILRQIYEKVSLICNDKQNQTYLKISLLIQFIKQIQIQVIFCIKKCELEQLFNKIFKLCFITFRLIKKFYSLQIIEYIKNFKIVLIKILQIYKDINSLSFVKSNKIQNLIAFIQNKQNKNTKELHYKTKNIIFKQTTNKSDDLLNPQRYAIKLGLRLLMNWKKIQSQKFLQNIQKQKLLKALKFKKQSEDQHLFTKNNKKQLILQCLEKEQDKLRRKCKQYNSKQPRNSDPVLYKVKLMKQIQQKVEKQFSRLEYLRKQKNRSHHIISVSTLKTLNNINNIQPTKFRQKRAFSISHTKINSRIGYSYKQYSKDNIEQRSVTIQQYREKLNICRKQVNSINRITLYKPDKKENLVINNCKRSFKNKLTIINNRNMFELVQSNKQKLKL